MEDKNNAETSKGIYIYIPTAVYYSSVLFIILNITPSLQITKRSVKRYGPGKCIPHIRLRVRWENEQQIPVRTDLNIALTGTLEEVSFVFECDALSYTPSMHT